MTDAANDNSQLPPDVQAAMRTTFNSVNAFCREFQRDPTSAEFDILFAAAWRHHGLAEGTLKPELRLQ